MNNLNKPMARFTRLIHPLSYLHQAIDQDLITLPKGAVYTADNAGGKLLLRLEKQRFCRGDNVTNGNSAFNDVLFFSFSTHIAPLKALEACPPFARVMLNLYERFLSEHVDPNKPNDIFLKYRGGTEKFIHQALQYIETFAGIPNPPDLTYDEALEKISLLKMPDEAYQRCPLNPAASPIILYTSKDSLGGTHKLPPDALQIQLAI